VSTNESAGVHRLWRDRSPTKSLAFAWLGQAGFAFRSEGRRWLIDPYLSDFLAEKYRGAEFPHVRMMPPPIAPEGLQGVEWVFCTHRHSDHMDPGSLPLLARHNPECRFFVPRAERDAALKAGVPERRLIGMNAGETVTLSQEITVSAIAAAHEMLKINERGEHHFLGFVFKTTRWTLYHSGDCVPYDGLIEELLRCKIDAALLPVNGRDAYRASRGVPGNLTFSEARELCVVAHIPCFVPHHFGMFEFNTPTPAQIEHESHVAFAGVCTVPNLDHYYLLEHEPSPHLSLR
jgi:L-ascorbate metabolism protein UlaG (beta-lactamase superfamily)